MFSHPETCELGCFILGNGKICLRAGSTNISGTQEWFAPTFQDLLPIHLLDAQGLYCVDITAVVLPTSLWVVARTYLAAVHVVLNIHKSYIKKPAIWPT